jgi:hypothetical protein
MKRMYGGRWISFLGIPPLTILLLPLMIVTSLSHRIARKEEQENTSAKSE